MDGEIRESEEKPTRAHHGRVGANYLRKSLWSRCTTIRCITKGTVLERTFDSPHFVMYCAKKIRMSKKKKRGSKTGPHTFIPV